MTSSASKYKKQTNKLQINKYLKTLLIFTWSNALQCILLYMTIKIENIKSESEYVNDTLEKL